MPVPLRPMLLTSAPTPAVGDGWIYEAKLDGWRCLVEVSGGRVQVYSRRGGDYTARLPELQALSCVDDAVLDGELAVVTDDGRLISSCFRAGSTEGTVAWARGVQ